MARALAHPANSSRGRGSLIQSHARHIVSHRPADAWHQLRDAVRADQRARGRLFLCPDRRAWPALARGLLVWLKTVARMRTARWS